MNARVLSAAAIAATFCGLLPARAADTRLMNLVMPDAKVLAGVNVQQASATPFGQYVLSLLAPQDQQIRDLATMIGFDPRTDVIELLVASNGAASHSGLALAAGNFDPGKVAAVAAAKGAKSEPYSNFSILEDPKQTVGVAFLNNSLVVAGPVAEVKAAIDRLNAASNLDAGLLAQVSQLSAANDAWMVSIAPLAGLKPPAGAPTIAGVPSAGAMTAIQQASGGIKFGASVVVTGTATTDTEQNATALAGMAQLVANMAKAQAAQNPQAAPMLNNLSITASGKVISLSLSAPTEQLQELLKAAHAQARPTAGAQRQPGVRQRQTAPRVQKQM